MITALGLVYVLGMSTTLAGRQHHHQTQLQNALREQSRHKHNCLRRNIRGIVLYLDVDVSMLALILMENGYPSVKMEFMGILRAREVVVEEEDGEERA